MDNLDHITRKIKEGFENIEFKAPEGLWSAISNNLKDNVDAIDEKIKSSLENTNERAPKGIWKGIVKQRTIDKVWVKVYKYLQLQTFYKWTRRAAAFIFLLLLVAIGFKNSFNKSDNIKWSQNDSSFSQKKKQSVTLKNIEKSTKTKSIEEYKKTYSTLDVIPSTNLLARYDTNIQPSGKVSSIISNSNKSDTNLFNDSLMMDEKDEYLLSAQKNIIGSQTIQNKEEDVSFKEQVVENSLTNNITISISVVDFLSDFVNNSDSLMNNNLQSDSTNNILTQHNIIETEEEKENNDAKKTKFELGITTALNSTAIINNTTINSLNETSLVAFRPSFGSNIGLQFVYHIHQKHSLGSNLIHSRVNQAYNKFSNGRFNEEKINISFIHLQPIYQFNYKRFENQTSSLNIKVGPYFGFVTKSKSIINGLPKSVNYRNYDFGVTLQIGQSVELKKLVLDYGLNLDKGLTNLNKGTNQIPAYFDKTTALGLGLHLSIRYKF